MQSSNKRQPPPQQEPAHASHAHVRQPPPSSMPSAPEQKDGEKRRDGATEQAHQKWLQSMAKFLRVFKYQKCEAAECPKHFNCMRYHGDEEHSEDRRRALKSEKDNSLQYKAEPCPHLFDYWGSQTFMHNYSCPDGLDCQYAHNWYELGYHYKTYKTVACPYLELANSIDAYQTTQCPFVRDAALVLRNFGGMRGIKRVKDNRITMNNAQVAAVDMCPFYHNETERRYSEDPPFPAYRSRQAQHQAQPHQFGQHQQQKRQHSSSIPQQPQPPPHLFLQQQQQQQQQPNMRAPSQNQVPPHLMRAQQQSQTLYGPGPPHQQKSTAQLQAEQAERHDFAEALGCQDNTW